jgi:hypothetical protein
MAKLLGRIEEERNTRAIPQDGRKAGRSPVHFGAHAVFGNAR